MKTLLSLLMALLSLVLLGFPALAQGDEEAEVTLMLTLNGRVPPGENFWVGVDTASEDETSNAALPLAFCGTGSSSIFSSPVACKGAGRVYTKTTSVRRGDTIEYFFNRNSPGDSRGETFVIGSRTLHGDTTISASYGFADSGNDQEEVPEMPDTGAGGMAGGGPLPGGTAALSSIVAPPIPLALILAISAVFLP